MDRLPPTADAVHRHHIVSPVVLRVLLALLISVLIVMIFFATTAR